MTKNQKMEKINALIVSHPGSWQKLLQKTVEAYSFVNVVEVVCGSLSAVQLAQAHNPDFMLLDSSIPFDELTVIIQYIKQEQTHIRTIVIVDTTHQQQRIIQAGADYTISSFRFEDQIGEILNLLKDLMLDEKTIPNQKVSD